MPLPGSFAKSNPTNGADNQLTNPTLSWNSSSDASSYEYCADTTSTNPYPSGWVNPATNTSAKPAGPVFGAPYYWQVRSVNENVQAEADNGTWWSYMTLAVPGTFNKFSPVMGASGQLMNTTLSWESSSVAASYEYCVDTTNDTIYFAGWVSSGTNTSLDLSELTPGVTYYWQVRAVNGNGTTYADGSSWWSFTTTYLIYLYSIYRQ
jgi:hypothetical protein